MPRKSPGNAQGTPRVYEPLFKNDSLKSILQKHLTYTLGMPQGFPRESLGHPSNFSFPREWVGEGKIQGSIACVWCIPQVDGRVRRVVRPIEVKDLRLVMLQNKSECNKEFEYDLVRLSESRTVSINILVLSKQGAVVDI